ncbi:MAG: hypothetical protein IPO92_19360 [Saprospiraceae bacterium]|nr:hypothetical protein [Saprospiraceae bacterium]
MDLIFIVTTNNLISTELFDSTIINYFSLESGIKLMQYSVTPRYDYIHTDVLGKESIEKNEIWKILGEYNGLLWVVLWTGVLIAFDVETGEEKYILRSP